MTNPDWEKIVTPDKNGVRLQVKISPGASRTKIIGPHDDCLKISIGAPPEKGKANLALVEFLSKLLNLPKHDIIVQSGLTNPRKTLIIQSLTPKKCLNLFKSALSKKETF